MGEYGTATRLKHDGSLSLGNFVKPTAMPLMVLRPLLWHPLPVLWRLLHTHVDNTVRLL